MAFIPGLDRLSLSAYSDARNPRGHKEEALDSQPELEWYMDRYKGWRSLYDGSALEETVSTTQDPSSGKPVYRWPVRFNLVSSYCQLHSGMLWGHGRSGNDNSQLFTVRVDPKIPGGPKPLSEMAPKLEDILNFFWIKNAHILRSNGVIQQWAGGCIVKIAWRPTDRRAVYGVVLEIIQPEHFYPIWNPVNFDELYAVKIKFTVSKSVAKARYNLSDKELERFGDRAKVPIEEYWDAKRYYVLVGNDGDGGVVARDNSGKPLEGPNPFIHPKTRTGVIPVHYIPRIRTGGFMGESLAYRLEGIQEEINKTLADYGDALTRGAHPPMGISDYTGPGSKKEIIAVPRHGALNLGMTRAGGQPPKVHEFPLPQVPPQTSEFLDRLHGLSEAVAGLTPAARGVNQGRESGLAIALQMLPTTNLVGWERSHVTQSIAGAGGINDTLMAIWWSKRGLSVPVDQALPSIGDSPSVFDLQQSIDYFPVVPRDRLDIIDEVVRLSTNPSVSPREWLRRLGDIEDVDEALEDLIDYMQFVAEKEAAVAGRSIRVSKDTNQRSPERAYPTISGETMQTAPKQAAKQPEGIKSRKGTDM